MSSSTRTSPHGSLFAALAGLTASAAMIYGCTGNVGIGPNGAAPGPPDGGTVDAGSDGGPLTPEQQFEALKPELLMNCSCHVAGLPPFLAEPAYTSITEYPGLVIKNWEGSKLLVYATGDTAHTGTQLDSGELKISLLPKVREWLEAEAARLEDPIPGVKIAGPRPINPLGFNSIYFDNLGDEFRGIALTFNAGIDATTMELTLTQMVVNPTKNTGVHIVHPRFQLFAPGSDTAVPEAADTFAMMDASYEPNQSGPFTDAPFPLVGWEEGAQLGITFDLVEILDGMGGGACGDPTSFAANAQGPLSASCAGPCHGGNDATAQNAMDLSAVDSDPTATCAIVRNRIDLVAPDQSQIFRNSDPNGGAMHPFKFATVDEFNAFMAAVTPWITAEQAAPMP